MDDPRNPNSGPLPGAPIPTQLNRPPVPPPPGQPRPAPFNQPPVSAPPRPPAPAVGGAPVPDLRFLDQKMQATTPAPRPAVPPTPQPPRPISPVAPVIPPRPAVPPVAPAPVQRPAPTPLPSQEFKTSIRTFGSDLEKIKTGQAPSGQDIQKVITPTAPGPVAPPAPLKPTSPTRPVQVGLGQTQRSTGLSTIPDTSGGAHKLTPPDVTVIDTPPRRSRTPFYLTILLLMLLGAGAYYYLSLPAEPIVEASPSPSLRPQASPTPIKTLREIFTGSSELVVLASSGNPGPGFQQKVKALPMTGGQFQKLAIQNATKGGQELAPFELFDRFLVTYPANIKNELDASDTIALAFGQTEKFDAKGQLVPGAPVEKRLVFISKVGSIASASATATKWEATMTPALAGLFGFTPAKAATTGFLTNLRQNASIRYRNFPFADITIDYSITNASNGKTYLIIANSREAAFAAIDAIKR